MPTGLHFCTHRLVGSKEPQVHDKLDHLALAAFLVKAVASKVVRRLQLPRATTAATKRRQGG